MSGRGDEKRCENMEHAAKESSANQRTRGQRYILTQKEKDTAQKIALLLSDSKAKVTRIDLIWREAKSLLVVTD